MENKFIVQTSTPERLFVKVYRDFLNSGILDGKEQIIFIHLKQYVNFTNDNGIVQDEVYPTLTTLAKNVKMTEKTVRTILQSLQRKGILEIKRQGMNKPNIYKINDSAEMWKSESVEELKEAVDEIEEKRMIEILTAKGYYISKEKEPVSDDSQITDTSTCQNNLHNDTTTDEPESQEECCSTSKADADALLDRLWELYPVKKGKGQISAVQRKKLLKIGYDEMARAIERYKQYVESVDYLHYQNASTFFNGGYLDYLDANYDPESEREARNNQAKSGQTKSSQTKNKFNDYPHRDYDFDAIKKSMFDQ